MLKTVCTVLSKHISIKNAKSGKTVSTLLLVLLIMIGFSLALFTTELDSVFTARVRVNFFFIVAERGEVHKGEMPAARGRPDFPGHADRYAFGGRAHGGHGRRA